MGPFHTTEKVAGNLKIVIMYCIRVSYPVGIELNYVGNVVKLNKRAYGNFLSYANDKEYLI